MNIIRQTEIWRIHGLVNNENESWKVPQGLCHVCQSVSLVWSITFRGWWGYSDITKACKWPFSIKSFKENKCVRFSQFHTIYLTLTQTLLLGLTAPPRPAPRCLVHSGINIIRLASLGFSFFLGPSLSCLSLSLFLPLCLCVCVCVCVCVCMREVGGGWLEYAIWAATTHTFCSSIPVRRRVWNRPIFIYIWNGSGTGDSKNWHQSSRYWDVGTPRDWQTYVFTRSHT